MPEQGREFTPKIYYKAEAGAGGRSEALDDLLRGEGRAYFQVDQSFASMLRDLKKLDEKDLKEGEEKEVSEKLERDWGRVVDAELNELQDLLDHQLLRFKSPYPYESRKPEQWFDALRDGVRRSRKDDWSEKAAERAEAWLDRTDADSSWGEANFFLQQGLGTVLPNFYDGKKMMQWVSNPQRTDPVAAYYELVFKKEPPGLRLDDEKKRILPEKAIEGIEIQKGLREKATKYQNENTFWRMALASVHQIDHHEGSQPTVIEKLSPAEIEFISRVFVDYDPDAEVASLQKLKEKIEEEEKDPKKVEELMQRAKDLMIEPGWLRYTHEYKDSSGKTVKKEFRVPSALLNWYVMDSSDRKRRRYLATMEVLLTENVFENLVRLEREKTDGSAGFDEAGMKTLVEEVSKKVQLRLNNWFSSKRTLDEKLASVVTRFGIVFDWAHMSSAEMSWGWGYELKFDAKEKKIDVKRSKPLGGPTTSTDSNTVAFWRESEMNNERKGWSKGMLPPMSEQYREELQKHPVGWRPNFFERLAKDPQLKEAWDALWAGESDWKWDPRVKSLLEKMIWYWETPYKIPGSEENLVLPIFFPPEIASLNFLNTISLTGDRDPKIRVVKEGDNYVVKRGQPTIWEQLRKREKISDLDWDKMGDQALYRWMITIGQTVRYLVTMLDPKSVVKDQYEAFFAEPGNLGELIKRADLGERDEQLAMTVLTMSLAPMLVVIKSLPDRGIFGEAGEHKDRRSDWAEELAKWITMFEYLPSEREGVKNYGKAMAKLTIFYASVVARIGEVAGKLEKARGTENYRRLQNSFGKLGVPIKDRAVDLKPPPPER